MSLNNQVNINHGMNISHLAVKFGNEHSIKIYIHNLNMIYVLLKQRELVIEGQSL